MRLSPREAVALIGALSGRRRGGAAPERRADGPRQAHGGRGRRDPVTVVSRRDRGSGGGGALRRRDRRGRCVAEVDYVDAPDRRTTRVIEPHRLVTIDGVAYVECFCRRAQDYRTLRLDRIAAAATPATTRSSTRRASGRFLAGSPYLADAWPDRPARWLSRTFPESRIDGRGRVRVAASSESRTRLWSRRDCWPSGRTCVPSSRAASPTSVARRRGPCSPRRRVD